MLYGVQGLVTDGWMNIIIFLSANLQFLFKCLLYIFKADADRNGCIEVTRKFYLVMHEIKFGRK